MERRSTGPGVTFLEACCVVALLLLIPICIWAAVQDVSPRALFRDEPAQFSPDARFAETKKFVVVGTQYADVEWATQGIKKAYPSSFVHRIIANEECKEMSFEDSWTLSKMACTERNCRGEKPTLILVENMDRGLQTRLTQNYGLYIGNRHLDSKIFVRGTTCETLSLVSIGREYTGDFVEDCTTGFMFLQDKFEEYAERVVRALPKGVAMYNAPSEKELIRWV